MEAVREHSPPKSTRYPHFSTEVTETHQRVMFPNAASMYSYGKIDTLCVKRLKFFSDKLDSLCSIYSLSLLRKNANLSKLEMRNLYKSIKRNLMQFFWLFLVLSNVWWMRYIFLLLLEDYPLYAMTISLMTK